MTTRISDEDEKAYYSKTHSAIVIRITDALKMDRAGEILRAVGGALGAAAPDEDDLPLWLHFEALEGIEVYFLDGHPAPDDKVFLGELIKSIPEAHSFRRITKFSYPIAKGVEKKAPTRVERSGRAVVAPRKVVSPETLAETLPQSLQFLACEAALKEARHLAEALGNWPNPYWDDAGHLQYAQYRDRKFTTWYPLLSRADEVLGGRLTKALLDLGGKPRQFAGDMYSFRTTFRDGELHYLESACDHFIEAIAASGKKGSKPTEVVDTAADFPELATTWDAARLGNLCCG